MDTYSVYDPNGIGVARGVTLERANELKRFYEVRQYVAGFGPVREYTIRKDQ